MEERVYRGGVVYMLPAPLGDEPPTLALTGTALACIRGLRLFAVENARTSRRLLARIGMPVPIDELEFIVFDKRSDADLALRIVRRVAEGADLGYLSEAGAPGIADPGAQIAAAAHQLQVRVVPFGGPSSVMMLAMASGMTAQSFAFLGYLPAEPKERKLRIQQVEALALREGQTQIFIETPYRNDALLEALLRALKPTTCLCIATGLETEGGWLRTLPVAQWLQARPTLGKKPTIFAIGRLQQDARKR